MTNKLDKARSDIGYLSFSTEDDLDHPFIKPAKIDSELTIDVGDPVGVYGYPYGETLHKREAGEEKLFIGLDRCFNKALSKAWHPSIRPK